MTEAVVAHSRARTHQKLNPLGIKAEIDRRRTIGAGATLLSDGGGLYLRIEGSGNARWTYRYTRPDGGRGERGLGSFGEVSLKVARDLVQSERERLKRGVDPVEARLSDRLAAKAARTIPTFGEAAGRYIDEKVAAKATNDKHIAQWRQTLSDAYCAALRGKRIDQVVADDVLAVLLQDTQKKAAGGVVLSGTLWELKRETASRLLDRIKRVLDWATVENWRTGDNPARWVGFLEHKLTRPVAAVKHHASMHYRDVPQFVADLKLRPASSARALELLVLTACRSGEVRGAVWAELDLVSRVWTIPAERMKARKEHRVPLTDRMIEIVAGQQPDEDKREGLIFPSSTGSIMSDMVFKSLLERMGRKVVTAHGFRSSFREWAGDEYGAADDIAEAALAHSFGSQVQRAYRRSPAFQLREKLMIAWGQHCASQTVATNVVKLRPRG